MEGKKEEEVTREKRWYVVEDRETVKTLQHGWMHFNYQSGRDLGQAHKRASSFFSNTHVYLYAISVLSKNSIPQRPRAKTIATKNSKINSESYH